MSQSKQVTRFPFAAAGGTRLPVTRSDGCRGRPDADVAASAFGRLGIAAANSGACLGPEPGAAVAQRSFRSIQPTSASSPA